MTTRKAIPFLFAIILLTSLAPQAQVSDQAAQDLGWRLGMQAYSFKSFTFFEAIDKNAAMGMKTIEAYSKHKISANDDATTHYTMSEATKAKIRAKLKSAGVKLVNYGVVKANDEAEWRKIFAFAKDMGIETLTAEPALDQMDLMDVLCDEYEINIAIHNHPAPSTYWSPETVLEAVRGRSKRIGACADPGHWLRSGLDPLECLKKLEGRIISLHFKDLDKKEAPGTDKSARTAHDVPWGSGVGNAYAMLAELKRQNFKGVFSIEYEHNWDNSQPEIAQGVDFFNLAAQSLVNDGYTPLFRNGLESAAYPEGGWSIEDGRITALGGVKGDIWTKRKYENFILDLDFKNVEDTNSGVFLRTSDTVQWLHTGIEVQIQQAIIEEGRHNCGGIFDVLAPSQNRAKPAGQWNHYTIIANDNMIHVILNGEQVAYVNLDLWTEAHKNPDGTKNKFNTAYKDMARGGYIGLQYHGHPVWFKDANIKLVK